MTTGTLLSVRAKSTRLPGKVFLPLYDSNVTEFLLRRLGTSTEADRLILATSTDARDADLTELALRAGIRYFCGSLNDKLLRYRDAARVHALDFVVIVDGDDPFVSITHLDRLIAYARAHTVSTDVVGFVNLPLGAGAWGIAASALEAICCNRPESNTEVWGGMFRSDARFTVVELLEDDPMLARPDIRMTLDYRDDYTFFTTISEALRQAGRYPSFEVVMSYLQNHPETIEVNRGAQAGYVEHLKMSMEHQM